MRVVARVLATVLAVAHGATALHAEDAGKVDWHKPQIGLPLPGPQFAPNFHRVPPYRLKQSWKSVILSATDKNVLAGINPADSSIVWRRQFEPEDVIVNMKCNDDVVALYGRGEPQADGVLDARGPVVVAALSGPGGASLRVFEATTGLLTFETSFHQPQEGLLTQPVTLSNDIAFVIDESPDLYVLTNGRTVSRVNGFTGSKKWLWTSSDESSSVLYTKVVASTVAVYVVGVVKSFRSYTLHVVALDSQTGAELASVNVPSDISNMPDSIIPVSLKAIGIPFLVWIEGEKAKYLALTPALDAKPAEVEDGLYTRVLDVNLELSGFLLGIRPDGSAQLLRLDADTRAVLTSYEFPASATAPSRYSESSYAGTIDRQNRPYVGRTFWAHQQAIGVSHVLSTAGGKLHGTAFKFNTLENGFIARGAIDCASPEPEVVVSRTLVSSSTGAMQLWQTEKLVWERDEGFSAFSAVEFVDLPEQKAAIARAHDESFDERIARHIRLLKDLPTYLTSWSQRFLTSAYVLPAAKAGDIWRDPFGFRKVIIGASRVGKVYALDSATGNVTWSKLLGTDARGGEMVPVRLFVLKTAAESANPEVVLIAQHHMPGEPVETVLYHFNALNGQQEGMQGIAALSGMLMFKSALRDAYILPGSPRVIALVDADLKVHMYPQSEEAGIAFAKVGDSLRFTLPSTSLAAGQMTGYSSPLSQVYPFQAFELWRTAFPAGEHVLSVVRRPHEPSATFGKVLADKRTLYRYLNPHLIAVVTSPRPPVKGTCAVNILDGAKGTIIYRAEVPPRSWGTPCDIHVAFSQNWLTYHYYEPADDGQDAAKGYRFITVEFFEGAGPDDKSSSPDVSAYSYDTTRVHVVQNSFVSTSKIVAMATTTTKFGITTRNLIVANSRNQIVSMPRRLLDPRRHKGKPSAADQEEGLVPYEPLVPDDPRIIISHNYQVLGVRHIVTSPALLESTSLILAFGLDLFGSRVTPSGTFDLLSESFNKLQLGLTVCGLLVAIIIVKPIARNKLLRQKWYG